MKAVVENPVQTIEEQAAAYKLVCREIEALEGHKKALAAFLRAQVMAQPEKTLTVGQYKLALVECIKESFDLKKARTHLSPDLLSPYLRITAYDYVRVS